MSWIVALCVLMSIAVVCLFAFALIVYLKEYAREEKTFNEILKARQIQDEQMANTPIYIVAPPKKKKASLIEEPVVKANKKNIN